MYLMYLLILILCFKGSTSEISTYYGSSGRNFLYGCERDNQNDKNITIKCEDGKVIQMEPDGYTMRDSIRSNIDCGFSKNYLYTTSFQSGISNLEDRIEVYKKCSHQNSCNIKIGGVEDGQQRLVNYPFYCHSESSIIDLSQKTVKTLDFPVFYFTGEKFTGQKIDCDCSVTGLGYIGLEIYFIHLKPNTSSRVRYLSQNLPLFEYSNGGITMLRTYFGYIGTEFKLEIRAMEPDKDDVIFFKIYGKDLFVNRSGCTNTTVDNKISTSSIDTTTVLPSTTTTTTTKDLSTTKPSTTDFSTTKPSTTDPVTIATTSDVLVSAASTDQTNDGTITVLGGILGAIILINIVGIALYCFLRHRKKQQKTPCTSTNISGNGEHSQYNYIDLTQDIHGSSSTNGGQNGDPRKSSDVYSVEGILKTRDSQDGPNNQYHVLEVDAYSAPTNTRAVDDIARQKPGNERRKQDDYDHIHGDTNSSIFQTNNTDTYNHIDSTMVVPRDATPNNIKPSDDYSHIENQNGVSNSNLELLGGDKTKQGRKEKNLNSGHEKTSYVNVNLEPDETPSSTDDVDTYNHLQN